ncbi:MAG: 2,3-diphosphoglycerate-dependent phosphoglycerate mutase [Patescibacteria group bacterium]|nr:2,3-diphosphoglycerate-dependent phosphoglycerate mutase [Patescibacteria group bacterium]
MNYLVIIRHGLTEWTKKFTGWTDIDLAPEGVEMTKKYAARLREENIKFDFGFTSVLKRGYRTLEIVLEVLGQKEIPVIRDWHLNERHYGALQGLGKPETAAKYGEEQVAIWRRSYDVPPPKLELSDPRHPRFDPLYKDIPPEKLPSSESLKDTYARTVPYFKEKIESLLKKGKNVILSGHSNSLRSIIKYLDNLSDEEIVGVNVPYCIPLVYEWEEGVIKKHYYLASDDEVKTVIEAIKNQAKK